MVRGWGTNSSEVMLLQPRCLRLSHLTANRVSTYAPFKHLHTGARAMSSVDLRCTKMRMRLLYHTVPKTACASLLGGHRYVDQVPKVLGSLFGTVVVLTYLILRSTRWPESRCRGTTSNVHMTQKSSRQAFLRTVAARFGGLCT